MDKSKSECCDTRAAKLPSAPVAPLSSDGFASKKSKQDSPKK